jgi:dipeptidyl-peptidase 4
VQWSKRRGGYTTLEKQGEKKAGRDLVWHDPSTGMHEILVPAEKFVPAGKDQPLSVESYAFSDDESKLLIFTNSRKVWRMRTRGDYWVLDLAAGTLKKLGGDAPEASLMFSRFSPDGSHAAFVRDRNLYVQRLSDMQIVPLTAGGSDKLINGTFDWVYEEELGLRDGFRWSPNGRRIAYWQLDTTGVREFYLVDNLDGLYSKVQAIPYPKAGELNSAGRIGIVEAAGGETRWLQIPGDPREHYIAQVDWAGNSDQILLQQFNRLQNTNRLIVADAKSGDARTILTETDAAWVENSNQTLWWFDDHRNLVWLSERDGWRHAYAVTLADGATTRITEGPFDVISIAGIDESEGWLYYIASPDNPTQRYLYRVRLNGGAPEKVTPPDRPGTHLYRLSPDARWAVHTFTTFDSPPVQELISLPAHTAKSVLSDSRELKAKISELACPSTEFFRVEIGDGVLLDGWCIKPPEFDPSRRYPLLFYVYGEPAGQTVLDAWPGNRQLWHWMLAQQGYVVMSVDNRGTPAPRGREWRKCIYRQIGVPASAEQAAAARAILKERAYLDPQRVAIWGWSGGGSMTLNAILRYPDLYHTGMSVAPVPDQHLYDTIYQERYMGLPSDNAEGYRNGSALNFAHQLRGNLLVVHGTGDDNCHYQGTEALVNELTAHNKQFSMFAYPGRSHSISEGRNTTRHLYGLLTRYLNEHMPAVSKSSN